jgi:hypothetical protein
MKLRLTFTEELLGTASADPEIHSEFIASKGPDAATIEEEVAALGADEVTEKSTTIFARDEEGAPCLWDYQVKGFFKDACGMLTRAAGTKSSKLTAYKKIIDGLVFVHPRQIRLVLPEGGTVGNCQRPLRAQTAKGERIALAHSETVPAGTFIEIDVEFMELGAKPKDGEKGGKVKLAECVEEWLAYGALRGLGQWRNSGKGRFNVETLD